MIPVFIIVVILYCALFIYFLPGSYSETRTSYSMKQPKYEFYDSFCFSAVFITNRNDGFCLTAKTTEQISDKE